MNACLIRLFSEAPVVRRVIAVCLAIAAGGATPSHARQASDVTGAWEIAREDAQVRCRIMLNAEQSDKGDYFVGVPMACRKSIPILGRVGRWTMPDATHLSLTDPGGVSILLLVADGASFKARGADGGAYTLAAVARVGRSVTDPDSVGDLAFTGPDAPVPAATALVAPGAAMAPILAKDVIARDTLNKESSARDSSARESLAKDTSPKESSSAKRNRGLAERPGDLAGRYAILRDKTHDTGCMLTLDDKTRVKGGERAALAPACRDQGIVVFDPSAWQLIGGRLVLTAKAGHTTHLDKQDDGTWLKDPGEGKSLSLKKL